ncbi:hypothetical protein EC973_009576 [Apophysomyces ossiformis]|uniref:XPG-I domain-containing protein n=1 Tax=Apophysomyces ossiformis TaxID=679940 RepID=A0A8H7BLN5_9FUNG|nr:hypothetical protein EC973_009576 [Apophysomyces ossiformis]
MGVQRLWDTIAVSEKRFSLEELAADQWHRKGNHGLRMAIDVALWLFHARSGQGGNRPDLRTMFYRCCRLYELGIRPVFVFDGPHRPIYKRVQIIQTNIVSELQMQLMEMFDLFKFGVWHAYGEAEAECAVLQRLDYVDIVLTADVDALLFGAKRVIRNWPSHRNELLACYDMAWLSEATGLDRSDLIMIALLRGSDYNTRGMRGVGITLAEGLVRTKHHVDLMDRLQRNDESVNEEQLQDLYDALMYEASTNRSGHLNRKYSAIQLKATSYDLDLLKDWINPISNIGKSSYKDQAKDLLNMLNQDHIPNLTNLAAFCQKYFLWPKPVVQAKFANIVYPSYMSQKLRRYYLSVNGYKDVRDSTNRMGVDASCSSQRRRQLVDYFPVSKYRCIEKEGDQPKLSVGANTDLISITQQKVVQGRKLYRVDWSLNSLQEFLDEVNAELRNTRELFELSDDDDLEWSTIENAEQGKTYYSEAKACRQWVDSKYVDKIYPAAVRTYEQKRPKKPTTPTTPSSPQKQTAITDFLTLPPRRHPRQILRSDTLEDPFN